MLTLQEGEYAHKYYSREIRGWFTREFPVPQGMVALLLKDECYERAAGPGVFEVDSGLGQFLKSFFGVGRDKNSAILVRASEIKLPFMIGRLLTRDPVFLDLSLSLKARLKEGSEALFLSNLMGDRVSLTFEDLKALLHTELKDAAQGYLKRFSLQEVADLFPDSLSDLEAEMEARLRVSLEASGLLFLQMEGLDFYCEAWDARTRALANAFSGVTAREAQLKGRRQLFELISQEELRAIAEETKKAENHELRMQLWERMRRAAQTDKMNELRSERDLEAFLREMDRDKRLKEQEYEEFKRNLADKLEDRDRARAHLMRIAELKSEYEYRRQEASLRHALTTEQQEAEAVLERRRIQAEIERVDLELQIRRKQGEAELARARLDAEKEGIKLSLEEKRRASEREGQALLEKQRLESKREELSQEIEYYEALNRMDPIAMILLAPDAGRASLLADMAKLKIQGGMTTEQILAAAVASGSSPQAAEALKELVSRANSIQKEEVYEKRLEEQRKFREELQKSHDIFIQSYKDVFEVTLKTITDIVQIRSPGGTAFYPSHPSSSPPLSVCFRCHQMIPQNAIFCPLCGEKRGG